MADKMEVSEVKDDIAVGTEDSATKPMKPEEEPLLCDVCDINIGYRWKDIPTRIQMHKKTKLHIKKVQMKEGTYVPPPEPLHCDICSCQFPADSASKHYEGARHKKNLSIKDGTFVAPQPPIDCEICNCKVPAVSAEKHFAGEKHKKKLAQKENPPVAQTCEVCEVTVNSKELFEAHMNGQKHAKKVAKLANPGESPNNSEKENKPAIKKEKAPVAIVQCVLCCVELSSHEQAKTHYAGKRHMKNMAKMDEQNGEVKAENMPMPASKPGKPVPVQCELCDVSLNSPTLAEQHFAGKKHMSKAVKAGLATQADVNKAAAKQKSKTPGVKMTNALFDSKAALEGKLQQVLELNDGQSADPVAEWFKANKVLCGICVSYFTNKAQADAHFESSKHIKATQAVRESHQLDRQKYCPICKSQLGSPTVAENHYKGKQHTAKLQMAKEAGLVDAQMLAEMDPNNAIMAAQLHYTGMKRSQPRSGGYQGQPPAKKPFKGGFRFGNKPSFQKKSDWVQGGTVYPDSSPAGGGSQGGSWGPPSQAGDSWGPTGKQGGNRWGPPAQQAGSWGPPAQQGGNWAAPPASFSAGNTQFLYQDSGSSHPPGQWAQQGYY